ncbi:hypothetical protein [Actinomadura hibisca]|uniref:hypothetical protein n=1 Tax=Actinomadura hibisca TaxID=68565 RepID=UPI0012F7EAE7|nr:hypothetical protein [Actinomadura hibisca]
MSFRGVLRWLAVLTAVGLAAVVIAVWGDLRIAAVSGFAVALFTWAARKMVARCREPAGARPPLRRPRPDRR